MDWAREAVAAYNRRPHSSLPKIRDPETGRKRHMSPDELWARHVADGFRPLALDAETAADLFRPYEIRQVRRGTVSLGKGVYYHRELDLGDWHGRQVLVGYDIHDPKHVWVRDLEERLICVATLGANRAAYFPKSRVEQARERRERGRLKRLERKAEEIRAEAMGPAIEFRPEEAVEIPLSTEAQARLDPHRGRRRRAFERGSNRLRAAPRPGREDADLARDRRAAVGRRGDFRARGEVLARLADLVGAPGPAADGGDDGARRARASEKGRARIARAQVAGVVWRLAGNQLKEAKKCWTTMPASRGFCP